MCNGTGHLDDGECYLCERTGYNCYRPFPPGTDNLVRVPSKWADKPVHEWEDFIREDTLKLDKLVQKSLKNMDN